MTAVLPVTTKEDAIVVAAIAHTIWTNHYTAIIGEEQVAYMLDKFQTEQAIKAQIKEGVSYYLLSFKNAHVGYFSFYIQEDYLFLSKLYVYKTMRGKGLGKAALDFLEQQLITHGLKKIRLTVNKYNTNSIAAYQKMGFKNIDSVVQDIGNGYVMDDYVLEKLL